MARNVFISFRFNDGIGYKQKLSRVFDLSTDIINYSEDVDRSNMKDDTIKYYLYQKLRRTSITIILLTPEAIKHQRNKYGQIDDWMYDEIRYSLEDREDNRCNGLIAVYTPETRDILMHRDLKTGANCINDVDNLFRKNMMNVKNEYKKNPNANVYDSNYDSYCSLISLEDFLSNPNKYIGIAEEKRDHIDRYNIVKRIQNESFMIW